MFNDVKNVALDQVWRERDIIYISISSKNTSINFIENDEPKTKRMSSGLDLCYQQQNHNSSQSQEGISWSSIETYIREISSGGEIIKSSSPSAGKTSLALGIIILVFANGWNYY